MGRAAAQSRLDPASQKADLGPMATVIDTIGGQRPRHPEKQSRPDTPVLRKPEWLRVRAPGNEQYGAKRRQRKQ